LTKVEGGNGDNLRKRTPYSDYFSGGSKPLRKVRKGLESEEGSLRDGVGGRRKNEEKNKGKFYRGNSKTSKYQGVQLWHGWERGINEGILGQREREEREN